MDHGVVEFVDFHLRTVNEPQGWACGRCEVFQRFLLTLIDVRYNRGAEVVQDDDRSVELRLICRE